MDGFWDTWVENWASYNHQALYDMVKTNAAGAGAVEAADQAWARFTAMMEESVDDVRQALAEAGASWEGLAADSMQGGVTPLAQWAQDAGTAGAASGGSVRQVGESFAFTANAMPEPVKVPSDGFPLTFRQLFAGQIDQDERDRAAQEAKQRAVELMDGYSRNADSAVTSVGTFVAPQSVAVTVPPPDTTVGRPFEYGGGSFEGPPGASRGPGGPSALLDAGAPYGGSPGQAPNPFPLPPDGGQTTTPGFADPTGQPVEPPRGSPSGGPPVGGPTSNPVLGFDPITGRRLDPVSGRPIDPTTGRPVGAPGSRGPGGAPGSPGRGHVAEDGHRAGRGGLTGTGPIESERAAAARGAAAGARAGLGGAGLAPVGAGTRRDEDKEHRTPDFLRAYHDEFWDDGPAVAAPVIGVEDDDPPPAAQPSN